MGRVEFNERTVGVKFVSLISTATRTFTESYLSFRLLPEFPGLKKKQPTFPHLTASFSAKRRLRNECRNFILMARH